MGRLISEQIHENGRNINELERNIAANNRAQALIYLEMSQRYLDASHPGHQEAISEQEVCETLVVAMKHYVSKADDLRQNSDRDWPARLSVSEEFKKLKLMDEYLEAVSEGRVQ